MSNLPFTSASEDETPDYAMANVAYESAASSIANGLIAKIDPSSTGISILEQTATTLNSSTAPYMQAGTKLYIDISYLIA